MDRAALTLAAVLASLVVSCAHHTSAPAVAAPAAAPPHTLRGKWLIMHPAPPIEPARALGRTDDESMVLVNTRVMRSHPVGVRLGPLLAMWQGWQTTLADLAPDAVRDLEWVVVVGPPKNAPQRMMARTHVDDPVLDGRVSAIAASSTEDAAALANGPVPTPAAIARLDGALRVVVRAHPHLLVVFPRDMPADARTSLLHANIAEPAGDDHEALRADIVRPASGDSPLPEGLRAVHVRVVARDDGGADAEAKGDCDDPGVATRLADDLRDRVARVNGFIVRAMTGGILNGLTVETDGPTVKARVSATRDQLDATATLAIGILGASATPAR